MKLIRVSKREVAAVYNGQIVASTQVNTKLTTANLENLLKEVHKAGQQVGKQKACQSMRRALGV